MQTDYLIIGQGIAGTVLGHTLRKKGYRIIILDDQAPRSASRVAAGLYNPVTGKRMTKTWKAEELFPFMESFYQAFGQEYSCTILHPRPVYKPFSNFEEQNSWVSKHSAETFIDTDIPDERYAPYLQPTLTGFGGFETRHSGHINTSVLLDTFREALLKDNCFLSGTFDPSLLTIMETGITYADITAHKIIFCEGMNTTRNPLFSWLPLVPSKGEILTVEIKNFTEEAILNKQVFIVPQGDGVYRAGSTYQWLFDSDEPTEKGKEELSGKLASMISREFNITGHTAGIRPAVKDRKPLIGFHPEHPSVAIFNGLGTKGVSLAPYFAENFAEHLAGRKQLLPEANIERFYSLYSRSEF